MKLVFLYLAMISLFLLGCGEKKEEKAPKKSLSCIKAIASPYSLDIEVKSVRCYFDKTQTILYPDYENELDPEWFVLENGEIKIAIDKISPLKSRACIEDACALVRYKENGIWLNSDYVSRKESTK